MKLDRFDTRILNLLQENNRITSYEMAHRVNLSPASCLRRMRRLRDEGAIIADISILAPEAVGQNLTLIVMVSVERESPELLDRFKRSAQRTPEVRQCYYVTGDFDFVLVISVANMTAYDAFAKRFFLEDMSVRRFSTMAVMNRIKFATMIPLEIKE